MPFKIRVGQRLSVFSIKKYYRGLSWMSKVMSSNELGVFEDYRCVPNIYNDFYMSVEKYDGFLKVEYVYTRK